MSTHYKLHDGLTEVIPWNARYGYPTQGNQAWKRLMNLPPKNASEFNSRNNTVIRIELPAQAYLNAANSTLSFDVTFDAPGCENVRLQNNSGHSIFRNVRFNYGSLILDELPDYNIAMRILAEGAGSHPNVMDQSTILEGIGGIDHVSNTGGDTLLPVNARLHHIHGVATYTEPAQRSQKSLSRRYCIQPGLGLLVQPKLLPLKWMASQCSIEFELASFEDCCGATKIAGQPSFTVSNVTYNAEIVEFNSAYDAGFLEGLRKEGVALHYASFDRFRLGPNTGGGNITLLISERNRSLKAAFCVLLPPSKAVAHDTDTPAAFDSHTFLQSCNNLGKETDHSWGRGFVKDFQWRIGGKYYPSQPVVCARGTESNGAAEAYFEFAKALNIVGDYRLSTGVTAMRWCNQGPDGTGAHQCLDWAGTDRTATDRHNTTLGPSCFVIAADFETSSGMEISGLNGEEQNDLALTINYTALQDGIGCQYVCFVYYDSLAILREHGGIEIVK
jgi:hypothetical protein